MDKAILEQLTFGFEIEGAFRTGMWERLGFKGEFVRDGSVNVRNIPFDAERIPLSRPRSCRNCTFNDDGEVHRYCTTHHARYRSEGSISQEYSSAVYQDLPAALKQMKLFNARNHVWDHSCGLHFHVGVKNKKYKQLWGVVSNYKYLKQLLAEARGYCEHQAERLRNQRALGYCTPYNTRKELIECTDSERFHADRQKYRFVRFHPEHKTLEFRFLAPCEHKVANVQKLLTSLTAYIGRTENVKSYSLAETDPHEPEIQAIEIKLSKKNPNLEIVATLGGKDSYKGSNHYYKAKEFQDLVASYGEEEAQRMINRDNEPVVIHDWDAGLQMPDVVMGSSGTARWVQTYAAGGSGSVRVVNTEHRTAVVAEASRHLPAVEVPFIFSMYDQLARQGRTPNVDDVYTHVMLNSQSRTWGSTSAVPMGTVLNNEIIDQAMRAMEVQIPMPYDLNEEDED